MAHNNKFDKQDFKISNKFLEPIRFYITGDKILTLCEGMSRNGKLLENLFNTFDVCDLNPSFGDLPKEK